MKSEVEEQFEVYMAGFLVLGEGQVIVVWVKFLLHILLHVWVFFSRRLCSLPPIPEITCELLHEHKDSCVMNSKLPQKLMAFFFI